MGKSVAERRLRQLSSAWLFLFRTHDRKNKRKRTSKQNKEVDAAAETCVHDGAGPSGAGTEASGCH